MKKKFIVFGILILFLVYIIFNVVASYANDGSIYVELTEQNLDGIGYGMGNPNNGGAGNYIWYLKSYNSNNVVTPRNLYCIKGNYGDTWNNSPNIQVEYNISKDLQKDREELVALLENGNSSANDLVLDLLDPQKEAYRELLWVLDNMYIEGETNKDDFLASFGIAKDEYGYYNENTYKGYDYVLTDADIIAVQRAVIWYFTNYKLDGESEFNQEGKSDWITITEDGEPYENLADITKFEPTEGEDRNEQVDLLYDYLVQEAQANAENYTAENNYQMQNAPVSVNISGLQQSSNGAYILQNNKLASGNYVIGPIVINKNNNTSYDITMTLTDQDGNTINTSSYKFTDSNGNSLGNVSLKDLVDRSGGFYISIDKNVAQQVNMQIDIKYNINEKIIWLNGTESTSSIQLNSEQPIVEVIPSEEKISVNLT